MSQTDLREIVLDTETTGLSPREGHRVVEIGCVELINHMPTGQVFHEYINPERDMPTAAFEVHGLSEKFLSDKPLFRDIAEAFKAFIGEDLLIIHNAPFDLGFLNFELGAVDLPAIKPARVRDTLVMAQSKHRGSPNSLDALCRRYRIDNSGRTKHGALLDAELLAEVYLELIGGAQANLTLVAREPKTAAANTAPNEPAIQVNTKRPNPLPPRLTSEDIAAHDKFVDALGDKPVWRRYLGVK